MEAGDGRKTRALVLHPEFTSDPARRNARFALDEAAALAAALPGLDLAGAEVVRLAKPTPGKLFGSGKVGDLAKRIAADEIELVLIDGAR